MPLDATRQAPASAGQSREADFAPAILAASELTVGYGAAPPIVAGFDLTIRRGEFVGLLGESGCGKSTAAYAMLGSPARPAASARAAWRSRARIC